MIIRDKNHHYLEKTEKDWVECELCHKIYTVNDCNVWEHSPPHKLERELPAIQIKQKKSKRSK